MALFVDTRCKFEENIFVSQIFWSKTEALGAGIASSIHANSKDKDNFQVVFFNNEVILRLYFNLLNYKNYFIYSNIL